MPKYKIIADQHLDALEDNINHFTTDDHRESWELNDVKPADGVYIAVLECPTYEEVRKNLPDP